MTVNEKLLKKYPRMCETDASETFGRHGAVKCITQRRKRLMRGARGRRCDVRGERWMELQAMVDDCKSVIHERGSEATVIYKIGRAARGNHIRLTPRSGPLGYVCHSDTNYTVARFKAIEILRWVKKLADQVEE